MSVTLPRPPSGAEFKADAEDWAKRFEDWARVAGGYIEDESRLVERATGSLSSLSSDLGGAISALGDPVAIEHGGTAATTAAAARTNLGAAPLASPVFTGDPQAPTPATADNDVSIATTAFVKAQGYATAAAIAAGYLPLTGGAVTGATSFSAGISLTGGTSNLIQFAAAGVAPPTFTTRSPGTKLVLYPQVTGSAVDYALGIDGGTLWQSVPTTAQTFAWYAGTSTFLTLGSGGATLSGISLYVAGGSVGARYFNDGSNTGLIFNGNWGWYYRHSDAFLAYHNASAGVIFFIDSAGSFSGAGNGSCGGTFTATGAISGAALGTPTGGGSGVNLTARDSALLWVLYGQGGLFRIYSNNYGDNFTITPGGHTSQPGGVTCSALNASGIIASTGGSGFYANGTIVLNGNVINTGWTYVYDNGGAPAIYLGAGQNLYRSANHTFQDKAGNLQYVNCYGVDCNGLRWTNNSGWMYSVSPIFTAAGGNALYAPSGSLLVGGDCNATGNTWGYSIVARAYGQQPGGGLWADSNSDRRTKRNIEPYLTGLATIVQLNPVTYEHNGKGGSMDDGRLLTGLIANDVQPVMPEIVKTRRGKLDPDDEEETDIMGLHATPLIYALVNAIKELSQRLAKLEGA